MKNYPENFIRLKNLIPEKYISFNSYVESSTFNKESNSLLIENLKKGVLEHTLKKDTKNLFARNLFNFNLKFIFQISIVFYTPKSILISFLIVN